ncbi:MAG: hypothetical protein AB4368_22385 [Xenococcaceae cyanobacterium]
MSDRANKLLEEIVQRVKDILNAETAVVAEVEEEEVLYGRSSSRQARPGNQRQARSDRYFWFVWDSDRG